MNRVLIEFFRDLNGRQYRLQCEMNAPSVDVKEALTLFIADIVAIEAAGKAQEEKAKQELPKQEETPKEASNGQS